MSTALAIGIGVSIVGVVAWVHSHRLLREARRQADIASEFLEGAKHERETAIRLRADARALTEEWVS